MAHGAWGWGEGWGRGRGASISGMVKMAFYTSNDLLTLYVLFIQLHRTYYDLLLMYKVDVERIVLIASDTLLKETSITSKTTL